jgi:hypothetical protein
MPRTAQPTLGVEAVNAAIKGACAQLVSSIGKSMVSKSVLAFLNELRASGHLSETVYSELEARYKSGTLV